MERKGRGRNRRRGSEEWEGVGVKEEVEGRGGCSSQLQLLAPPFSANAPVGEFTRS